VIRVELLSRSTRLALDRLSSSVKAPHAGLQLLKPKIEEGIDRRFKSQTEPSGKPWTKLKPATILARRRAGLVPIKILTASGKMRGSIKVRVTRAEIIASTNAVQAATHNFGDKSRHIPRRRFLGLSPRDENSVVQVLSRWVSDRIRQEGLSRGVSGISPWGRPTR